MCLCPDLARQRKFLQYTLRKKADPRWAGACQVYMARMRLTSFPVGASQRRTRCRSALMLRPGRNQLGSPDMLRLV